MSVPTRLVSFLAGLAVVFAGSAGVGTLVPQVMDTGTSVAGTQESGDTPDAGHDETGGDAGHDH